MQGNDRIAPKMQAIITQCSNMRLKEETEREKGKGKNGMER